MPVSPSEKARREQVWSCVLINQCATPGLGSLLCRRIFSGIGQLLLAVAGFVLVLGWMWQFFYRLYLKQSGSPAPQGSYGWMGRWGLLLFGAGWLWALFTSVGLLRQVRAESQNEQRGPSGNSGSGPDGADGCG